VIAPSLLTDSVLIVATTPTGLTDQSQLAFAPKAAQVVLVSGDAQSLAVGTQAGAPLIVQVQNAAGAPFPLGFPVDFAVVTGPAGTSLSPLSSTTDAQGFAQTILTAGGIAGPVQVSATAAGLTGSPVVFSATVTGVAGAPASLVAQTPLVQAATVGAAVAQAPSVKVVDAQNVPVPGVQVTFAVASGGGSVTGGVQATAANGIATVGSWIPGTVSGPNTLTATVNALTPLVFTANAAADVPDTLVIIAGDSQTAAAGTQLPIALVVEVRDQFANLVQGATVNWSPVQGSASPTSSVTDNAGRTQTLWTLGTGVPGQTLTASATGAPPTVFHATATFATPTVLLGFATIPGVGVGLSTNVTVGLSQPAGIGGVNVGITSQNTSIVTVQSANVLIPQGQTTGSVVINGIAVGTTTITGSATGFTSGTLSVDVQNRNIAVPPTLNVPYGQTASLPIQLPAPAPAGGVTFAIATSDASKVGVLTPSVTIAAGGTTANATLSGVLPGPATITVANPAYITGTSLVTTAATLNIQQFSATLNSSFGAQIDIDFTSNGQGIAAPAPGVTVTPVIADPTCVAAAPVAIPTGLVSTPMQLTYGGTATLPCTTQLKVTAPNIQADSITVTVNAQPGISLSAITVGSGLQIGACGTLGASNHGGVTVTLSSTNPNLLLAPNGSAPGSTTLNIFVPNNQNFFTYTVQALEGQTGTTPVTLNVSAPGFANGSGVMSLVQGAIDLIGVPSATTTLSPISNLYARTGIPNSQASPAFLVQLQAIRAGAPGALTITFADDDPGSASTLVAKGAVVGDTLTASVPVLATNSPTDTTSNGVALLPQAAGTSTISASASGFLQVGTSAASAVVISQPGIALNTVTVGSGLQVGASGSLGASNHGGVTVTLTSGDPDLLLAPNSTTPGSATLNIPVANGQTFFTYVVQGMEGHTGSTAVNVTASAPGFSSTNATITLVQGAIDLIGVPSTTTTLSPISSLFVRTGIANSQTTPAFLVQLQAVRAGAPGPLVATFANTDPGNTSTLLVQGPVLADTLTAQVGVLSTNSPTDTTSGGVAFKPQAAGSANVAAFIPGFLQTNTAVNSPVTISQPGISVSSLTVGSGLQIASSGNLGASNHGGVTVTLTSGNPNLLLSSNATTVGSTTLNISVPNGQTFFSYVVQAIEGETGTTPVTITATAAGFSNGSGTATLVEGAIDLIGVPATTTTLSPITNLFARTGIANSQSSPAFLVQLQAVRAGAPAPLTITMSSQTPAVGDLVKAGPVFSGTQTTTIPLLGANSPTDTTQGGIAFHPVLAGTTIVSASTPGFLQVTSAVGSTATITQPAITVSNVTVGSGLQINGNGSLGAPNHGGTTVTLTSSNPALLLSPDASTPGASSINVFVPNGTTFFGFMVQGLEGQIDTVTAAITAVGSGFTNGNGTVAVIPPAFDVIGLNPTQSAGGSDNAFFVRVGIPNSTGAFLTQLQAVRAGAPGPLTATMVSNAPGVGTLVTTAGSGASRQVQVTTQQTNSPTTVVGGGVALRPLTPGSVTITTTIPGYIGTSNAAIVITVQ
jgi:adhesin/invasin